MANYKVTEVTNRWQMREFIELPYSLYKGDKNWEFPLRSTQWDLFNPAKETYLRDNSVKFFYIGKGFNNYGRIAVFIDKFINRNLKYGNLTGFWGFFECVDDREIALELLGVAEDYLKEEGCARAVGPMSYSTLHNFALLVEGFDFPARIYTQYNQPYYEKLIMAGGYSPTKEFSSFNLSRRMCQKNEEEHGCIMEKRIHALDRIYSRKDVYLRPIDVMKSREESKMMSEIYNDAFSETWGFIPLTEDKAYQFFQDFKDVADPKFIPIAFYQGEPAGFCLTLPDVNAAFRRAKGKLLPFGFVSILAGLRKIDSLRISILGVRKRFQTTPVGYCLIMDVMKKFFYSSYKNIEVSLVSSENRSHTKIPESFGAVQEKTWRVYEKGLIDA